MASAQDSSSGLSSLKSESENSTTVKSKREKLFNLYFHQNFSLPFDSIIYYIAKNPTSPEMYQKMIQTCKYFFVKNPILVIPKFAYCGNGKWELFNGNRWIDLTKITSKLWITGRLIVKPENSVNNIDFNQNVLSSIMPKIYQCDAKSVTLSYQTLCFYDLHLLISAAEKISFINLIVKDKNGVNIAVEKIVEICVKAKKIELWVFKGIFVSLFVLCFSWSATNRLNITLNTMKELLKYPHFLKLNKFILKCIPETFDLETFYNYMKKNNTTKFWLYFEDSISEAYKNRLEEIIDDILETETRGYKPPLIDFRGQYWEKYYKLRKMFSSH